MESSHLRPQVEVQHYQDWFRYQRLARWISYWHQIALCLSTRAETCLEIGVGTGVVRDALRKQGVSVTTVDVDEALGVDRVGDVRALPCSDYEFDAVLCAQVLEHIPFTDLPSAVGELRRVSRKAAVISLPQRGASVSISMRWGFGSFLAERGLVFRMPDPRRFQFDGQHYWEIGSRGASRRQVRTMLNKSFTIEQEFTPAGFPYHRFYRLKC